MGKSLGFARLAVFSIASLGCSAEEARPAVSGELSVEEGTQLTGDARIGILWSIIAQNDEWGAFVQTNIGTVNGGRFSISTLPIEPPVFDDVPRDEGALWVGAVFVYDSTKEMPSGFFGAGDEEAEEAFEDALLGYAPEHAIIWQDGLTLENFESEESFEHWRALGEDAYQCGHCARVEEGFDYFEPASCESVQIRVAPDPLQTLDGCNWT